MTRRLIVNADDFGRTRGVSAGIIRAHQAGIVSSATAMMNMPGVAADLHHAKAQAPRLGLGVHLNFTAGRPLLPPERCTSLVDPYGHFLTQEAIATAPNHIQLDELHEELTSQITTFRNATGTLPDHLDAHHFVHLYPPLFEVYLDLAESFKLPVRIPFPRREADLDQLPSLIGNMPPETVRSLGRTDQQLLAARAITTTDHFVATFYDKTVSVPFMMEILASLPQGSSELMTHPGLLDDQLRQESRYNVQREEELAVLTHSQVIAYLEQWEIQLCTYADL